MNDPRVDELLRHPTMRALLAGGLAFPLTAGARTDSPGGPAVNLYETGGTIVLQVYSPAAGAWTSVTLS